MPSPTDYFLNSPKTIVLYQTIEISHPNFSKTFRLVRNNSNGITATLETTEVVEFEYLPMKIDKKDTSDDLDYGIDITFGDLGEILPAELDLLLAVPGSFDTKPAVIYRAYRSDDLSEPIEGPVNLQLSQIVFNKEGSILEAIAPRISLHSTGAVYRVIDFPTMRAFL